MYVCQQTNYSSYQVTIFWPLQKLQCVKTRVEMSLVLCYVLLHPSGETVVKKKEIHPHSEVSNRKKNKSLFFVI